ncbi:sensor domain-containing protein [Mycolicibacterium sp.]|uniref:sensor domain-containing protein n=1 Tax=Mycolicibacterium sp. TaxID=2320850 RepID=UPI001A2FCCE5|nr:sensor domain-containing protein [Mycolicibacterium sp.]MBJ7398714.1 sensor domain-containing protein [Mycolicibacterium sp.]
MASVMIAACATAVDGSATRQPPFALQQALPTAEQVRAAVGNPLDATSQPVVGSIDVLPNGIRGNDAVDPIECLGAITPLMRWVYEKGDVRGVAWQDFARFGEGQTVSSADTGVVRFVSDAEASRMFSQFVTRWRSCEGGRVGINAGGSDLGLSVTDVAVAGPILSATILSGKSDTDAGFPTEHAVGLSADCIVDVDVAVTAPDPARRVATTRAVDLARAMLDNLSRLP